MDEGIPLGKVVGFPLSIDWSVLVIMWLFTWSLAATLPDAAPGHSSSAYWLAGACGAAVLLASLLAHELTHAIVARHAGCRGAGSEAVVVRGHRAPRRRGQDPWA